MFIRKKQVSGDNAFSLLELSVAVGVAAILAVAGIVASTAFIGSAQEKSSDYTANASSSINDAEEQSIALSLAGGLQAPVALNPSSLLTDRVTVSWSAGLGDVEGYRVRVDGVLRAELDATAREYTVTGLDFDTSYVITVSAFNSSDESLASTVEVTTDSIYSEVVDLTSVDFFAKEATVVSTSAGPLYTSSYRWEKIGLGSDSGKTDTNRWTFVRWKDGVPYDYATGEQGWRLGPFAPAGATAIGFERPTQANPTGRQDYFIWEETFSQTQGGVHTNTSWAEVISDALVINRVDLVQKLEGSTITLDADISEANPGSLPVVRYFYTNTLPATYMPEYTELPGNKLLIVDTSGTHAAVVLEATTTQGNIFFRGRQNINTLLTPTDRTPTIYVKDFDNNPKNIVFKINIIDYNMIVPMTESEFNGIYNSGDVVAVISETGTTYRGVVAGAEFYGGKAFLKIQSWIGSAPTADFTVDKIAVEK